MSIVAASAVAAKSVSCSARSAALNRLPDGPLPATGFDLRDQRAQRAARELLPLTAGELVFPDLTPVLHSEGWDSPAFVPT